MRHQACMYIQCRNYNRKPETGIPTSKMAELGPVIDTSTSGLPITKAKAEYLETRRGIAGLNPAMTSFDRFQGARADDDK